MALIVPNATAVGSKYLNINQAEPDSVDLEILGLRTSAIRQGGVATASLQNVNISSGVAIIQGVPYTFSAGVFGNTAPSTGSAFTLIVVRLSGGVATVTAINGAESATNPTLPPSRSTISTAFDPALHFDPDTDVALATVFRSGSNQASCLVDKRVMYTGTLQWTQTAVPDNSQGSIGDIVTATSTSQVYFKVGAAEWRTLVTQSNVVVANRSPDVDEIVPIGGIIMWPATSTPPSRYVECLGQASNSATYPLLATAWGLSGDFNFPNYTNLFPRGGGVGNVGGTGGADTVSVPLKDHSHTLSAHTHPIDHSHPSGTTVDNGSHTHTGALNSATVSVANDPTDLVARLTAFQNGGFTTGVTTSPFNAFNPPIMAMSGGLVGPLLGMAVSYISGHGHTATVANSTITANPNGTHNHTFTTPTATGVSSQPPTVNTTNTVGDGSASPTINTVPSFRFVRYFVRAF